MTPTLPLEPGDMIDGVDGPTIILAPPKHVPAVRATVTVRRQQGHGGGTYWSLA